MKLCEVGPGSKTFITVMIMIDASSCNKWYVKNVHTRQLFKPDWVCMQCDCQALWACKVTVMTYGLCPVPLGRLLPNTAAMLSFLSLTSRGIHDTKSRHTHADEAFLRQGARLGLCPESGLQHNSEAPPDCEAWWRLSADPRRPSTPVTPEQFHDIDY